MTYTIIEEDIETKEFLSIAMLTYNHEKFISEAIESVLFQKTNFSYKIVIAEDFSTDKTRDIVISYQKKYPDKIRLLLQDKNAGANENNRTLFKNLKGKYIAALEGDDYWTDPLKLQKQVDFLEANQEYVMCFHKVKILKPDGKLVDDLKNKIPKNYQAQETLARLGNYINTPSVVFRNIISNFPDEFHKSPIGDYFLYMLLSQNGLLKHIQGDMAVYRSDVGVWSAKSSFYKRINTSYTFALLVSYFREDPIISKIFISRISEFLLDYRDSISNSDLERLNTCSLIFPELLKNYMDNENIEKIIISRIKIKTLLKLIIIKLKNNFTHKINNIK